jgi:hypothetical protein
VNLSNAARSQLSRVPGLNKAIDFICARANVVFSAEHNPENGTHTNITALTLTLYANLRDALFGGNVSSSLIPTAADLDLGAVIGRPGADPVDHPWRDLRLSRTLYIGAAWEETVIDGIPNFSRGVNNLELDLQGNGLDISSLTDGSLLMESGVLDYDGEISAEDGFRERNRAALLGEYTSVAFAAGNFTASAGNWTLTAPDQITLSWAIEGKKLTVAYTLTQTSVSAAPVFLQIAIPGGFTAATRMGTSFAYSDNGVVGSGLAVVAAAGTVIALLKDAAGTAWAISANNTSVEGVFTFEIQ